MFDVELAEHEETKANEGLAAPLRALPEKLVEVIKRVDDPSAVHALLYMAYMLAKTGKKCSYPEPKKKKKAKAKKTKKTKKKVKK